MEYVSIQELIDKSKAENKRVYQYVIDEQSKSMDISKEELFDKMKKAYDAMKESVEKGLTEKCELKIEESDGAKTYKRYVDSDKSILGKEMGYVMVRAIAVSELNACMGKIVAAPTAGSCGIMPACLVSIQEAYKIKDEDIINAMFTASAIGMVIANTASIAGATGGCQAECGVAQAMSAAAIVEILSGDYDMIMNAVAISIKNIEGLVCDPVAGLVECPCIKRNASGTINAILAADMALAGLKSAIPVDEVIKSMKQIGDIMDDRLKETAKGGLAATPTGKYYKQKYKMDIR